MEEDQRSTLVMLKESGKFGISTIFNMLFVILLFAVVNIIIFIYSFSNGFETHKTLFTSVVLLIGFLFTIIAAYKMYRYNLMKGFSSVYKHISPFFQKVSTFVVDKSEDLLNGKKNLKNTKNSKSINVKQMLTDKYEKVPGFLKYGMTFIINKIPFVEMLTDLKEDMKEDNKAVASEKLHGKINHFISNSVFGNNNKKWIFWLLPLNIIIQLVFIYVK